MYERTIPAADAPTPEPQPEATHTEDATMDADAEPTIPERMRALAASGMTADAGAAEWVADMIEATER